MIPVHLSAFLDFVNIFIRYRPKQRTCDGFHYGFFPIKKLFLQNENLNKFRKCLLKAYILQTFKFDTSFFSSCRLICLVNIIWFAPALACFVVGKSSRQQSPNSTAKGWEKVWNISKVNSEGTRAMSTFLDVRMSMRSFWCFFC